MNYKVVWISTAPRTGSMWAYNVARRLLSSVGFNMLPGEVPQYDDQTYKIFNEALDDPYAANRYCLKVHGYLAADLPRSKIITTLRDPRDVCVSYMNFMKCDFETAMPWATSTITFFEKYAAYDPEYLYVLKYQEMSNMPLDAVKNIASFLELDLEASAIQQVVDEFAKEKVSGLIDARTRDLMEKVSKGMNPDPKDLLYFGNGTFRVYDRSTGFQTGHVSGNRDGSWMTSLSEKEKESLNDHFGDFCKRNGFD
jgi:hypothetical protein